MSGFFPGSRPSITMCALENEGFFIVRELQTPNKKLGEVICEVETITLSKEEKFFLYEQLRNNIEIHWQNKGRWFLSPLGEYYLTHKTPAIGWRLAVLSWIMKGLMK